MGLDGPTVQAVLADWRTAPIDERLRVTLGLLETLTLSPMELSPADLAPLRLAGVSNQAIEEAIYVCWLFNMLDRLADAFDFEIPSATSIAHGARFLFHMGYGGASLPG